MRAVCNGPSFCNLIQAAALAALSLAATTIGAARAEAECEYPDVAAEMFVAPENRVGEFRITFNPPDFRDAAAVQRHLAFATVWARILGSELSIQSNRLCSVVMTPLRYPDLDAYLIINRGEIGTDPSICVRTLQDTIVNLRPSAAAVRNNAEEEASWRARRLNGDTVDPLNILITARMHIYRPNTVMHSLYAIGPQSFRLLSATAFRAWLEDQWESGRRIDVRPVELCSLAGGQQGMRPRAAKLPYSSLIPPGIVRISAGDGGFESKLALRHGVVVGHHGILNGWRFPLVAVTKGKYCGRYLTLPSDGEPNASFSATVQISCLTSEAYDHDTWTVFFCEDCPSRQAVEAAMTAIANDPDVIALALSHAVNGQPRGPYLITIDPDTEQ
jgi:hypothetical protein